MRDISHRIRRYRLSRYAPPVDAWRRRMRWAWVAGGLWLVWVGLVSDHSLYRIWRLSLENARAQRELERVRQEAERLDEQLSNPKTARDRGEHELRERKGMAGPGEFIYRIRPTVRDTFGR